MVHAAKCSELVNGFFKVMLIKREGFNYDGMAAGNFFFTEFFFEKMQKTYFILCNSLWLKILQKRGYIL